jgi:DNA-binding LytR/AlgR family response regulator
MDIAICDDNRLFLAEMQKQLQTLPTVEHTFLFSDLNAFLFSVDSGKRYDAVLMDIDWDQDSNGMDVAEELYKLSPETKIIYVTGYSDRFSQRIFLYRANLSGYLTKPVDRELLQANLNKVAAALPFNAELSLMVRRQGTLIPIPFREIYCIESWKHTVTIYSNREAVISYERLAKIMESLPADFFQCHKSYIVNMRQIQRFQPDGILLKNGKLVPVSRSKYNATKQAYLSFIGKTF